jgi:DNA-binding transcriptional LysR family regulator
LQAHALSLTQGLESRLALAIAPELLTAPYAGPLATLARDFPLLEVEVLAAQQADALRLLHEGRVQLALVFERPSLDGREGFQEVGSETLVAVMAPHHPVLQAAGPEGRLSEAHLIETRQIVVASRDRAITDPRIVFARQVWRTDAPEAALSLIEAGLGWGWLPRSFVRASLSAGTLRELPFGNLTNALQLWVDVVWSKERPLGLGARRFIEMMRALRESLRAGQAASL